jgi:hypothetical protein
VVNAGQEISKVPEAADPSPRYTVSETVVVAGAWLRSGEQANTTKIKSRSKERRPSNINPPENQKPSAKLSDG